MLKVFGLVPVLLVVGCGKGGFQSAIVTDSTLRIPLDASPLLDPALSQDIVTGDLMRQVFEGLVRLGEDNKVEPCLAEKWEVSEDGTTYTFHLRKGVRFHNGRLLKSSDVVWSLSRCCRPDTHSPIARTYLGDIVGAEEVLTGSAETIIGLRSPNDMTVEIKLIGPRPYFLGKLTYPTCAILAKEATENGKEIVDAKQMVGTGPFKMQSYTPERAAILDAFSDYWDGRPGVDRIEMPIIKDSATRINKFRTGEVDLIGLPRQDVDAIRRDPERSRYVHEYSSAALVYLGLNESAFPAFKDPEIRKAIAMSIDKKGLVRDILSGVVQEASSILPPGMPGHRSDAGAYLYDLAAAKAILAAKNLPPLELTWGGQSQDGKKNADAIVGQLIQGLGVQATVRQLEWRAYIHKATSKELAFFVGSWYADYLDPENFLSATLASYGQNRVAYSNPRFTELCKKADALTDESERIKLYQEAETMAIKDAVWIPLFFEKAYVAVNPRISGLRRNLIGYLPHSKVIIKKSPQNP